MMRKNIKIIWYLIIVLWGIHLVQIIFPINLLSYGIHPRSTHGLMGILCAPFLHLNWNHLIANTMPLCILLFISLTYNSKLTISASIFIILMSGLMVWIFGKPASNHIGASGLVFGLIGFLLGIGFFTRELKALLVSILVGSLYGYAIFSLLSIQAGISWAGHFFGFVSGVVFASFHRKD